MKKTLNDKLKPMGTAVAGSVTRADVKPRPAPSGPVKVKTQRTRIPGGENIRPVIRPKLERK